MSGEFARKEAAETLRRYRERMKPVWDGFAEKGAREPAKARDERPDIPACPPREDHKERVREAVKDWREGQAEDLDGDPPF